VLHTLSRVETWTVDSLKERFGVPEDEAREVLQKLSDLGYVELESSHGGTEFWRTTIKGNALGLASAARPLNRATANRALEQFLARVQHVNADPYYLFRVKKVVVFGSFLSEKEKINDIDIGVYLQPKEPDMDKHFAQCQERSRLAAQQDRSFSNYVETLAWAETEVLKFLKSRARAIGLHHGDPILEKVEVRTLFEL
jgi:predicted nucleotidyltransferase